MRATFAPTAGFCRSAQVAASLSTIEQPVELDDLGKAAVITTAIALGIDASNARAYSLGCGMELAPDPDRRLMLTGEKDALGLPRLKLEGGSFGFDPKVNRTVSVSTAAITEALRKVYDNSALVTELTRK